MVKHEGKYISVAKLSDDLKCDFDGLEPLMEEFNQHGYITCICGNKIEVDGLCECGEPNPLENLI